MKYKNLEMKKTETNMERLRDREKERKKERKKF